MNFLPIAKLGPHAQNTQIHFGVLLPGIKPEDDYQVLVRVIHERDQFIQTEPAYSQALTHGIEAPHGDYWETTVDLGQAGNGKHWGQPGRYVYRFVVIQPNGTEIDWIIDPCAREFGVGRHAAFTYGYEDYPWSQSEAQWQTPQQKDLILYEMNIMEFAGSLDRAVDKLDYLQDLGITGISLMPVTNISDAIDWGYTPIGYFGVDERFGKRRDFQAFVDAAHQRGIAVLVDAIYGHTSSLFPYEYLYSRLAVDNPFMGSFSQDMFAPSVDWRKSFPQDFFYTVNRHWLEVYHIDGFRYDCVPNYWELAPHFRGFASIAYYTYQWVKSQVAAGHAAYQRFADGAQSLRLVQCAEQLEEVKNVLEQTYSTCTWQNSTLAAVEKVAQGQAGALSNLGRAWGAADLPTEGVIGQDALPKAPLQYFENHDHSRFVCQFGTYNPDEQGNALFEQGLRAHWINVQPYLIGMLMAKGIPLLWQGQELCENNKLAASGLSRTGFLRIVHWEYFYSTEGRSTLSLVRKLTKARQRLAHVKDGAHYYFNDEERYNNLGLLLFARYYPGTPDYTLVALNFTQTSQWVPFWFPVAGKYREELHGGDLDLINVQAHTEWWIEVPSNYGRVWTHE